MDNDLNSITENLNKEEDSGTVSKRAKLESQISGIETKADLISTYIAQYKILESNELVCEKLGITEASGLKLLSNKHIFSILASEGCYMDSESIYSELLDSEQAFINEYMLDFDPNKAATRAGYKQPYAAYRRLLSDSRIRYVIMCRQQELREISQVTSQAILNEFSKIAFADIGDFVEFDNNIVTLKESNKVDTSVISEVQSTQYGVKIKLHNKHAALEAMGKHIGMFKEKLEITGKNGDPIKIESDMNELRSRFETILKRAEEQAGKSRKSENEEIEDNRMEENSDEE